MDIYKRGSVFRVKRTGQIGLYCEHFDIVDDKQIRISNFDISESFNESELEHLGFDDNVLTPQTAVKGQFYYIMENEDNNYFPVDRTKEFQLIQCDNDNIPYKMVYESSNGGHFSQGWIRNISKSPLITYSNCIGDFENMYYQSDVIISFGQIEQDDEIEFTLPKMQNSIL